MEGDAAVGVGARGAVLEVALDGAADVGELTTDLVVAAGEEFSSTSTRWYRSVLFRYVYLSFASLASPPGPLAMKDLFSFSFRVSQSVSKAVSGAASTDTMRRCLAETQRRGILPTR